MIRFENRQVFATKLRVANIPGMQREEKREIGIVGIQKIEIAKIKGVVPGDRCEKRIQQVVAFVIELRIVNAKYFVKLSRGAFDGREVLVVEDDGQRKLPVIIAMQLDLLNPFPQFANLRFFRVVQQGVLRRRVIQIDLAEERT